ncbi:hypothetical protein E8E14_014901 [Neopestalotiopsis sp. 37M]|nr:hypothetical protein E8E14_014901 [Neopestalotiopsis sp. 37M]
MADSFISFAKRIGLSDSQAKVLQVRHASSSSNDSQLDANLKAACQAAQLSLGSDQVENPPEKDSLVEKNWSLACIAKPNYDKSIASVGPGQRWGDVDVALSPSDVAVLGARAGPVGVGGLLLGGGYHFLSAEHGLSANNIVLSDGTITNANAREHSDLFWTLKGGDPNFGTVTRCDLYTYPLKATWLQLGVYSLDQAQQTLEAFAAWHKEGSNDPKANVILTIALDAVFIGLAYNEALEVRNTTGANQTFAFQHVPESLVAQGVAKGGNALNIPHSTHQWWTTLVDWTNAEDDETVRSVTIDTAAEWEELSLERGLDVSFHYKNDASRDQNLIATYGTDNVNKLKSIAQRYDKSGLFQTQQNGGFLLSKV